MGPIRILLIPSSDYIGHPFPQRHNHLFERIHDGKEFEVHVIRFNIFGKSKLKTNCIIHEIPIEIKTHNTAFYYASNIASYTSEILNIIKRESIDVVVAGNILPPLTYLLFRKLTNKKTKFIFDLQDYYPTSATGYIINKNNSLGFVLENFFKALTDYIISRADAVTAPGIALASYAKKAKAKRVYIVPNGISKHFLKKYNRDKIREKIGYNKEDIVIGYVGSIEFWLDMKPLIIAIAKARSNGIPVRFLLIGKHLQTGYPHKVEKWIEEYNIKDITLWLDFVPHHNVPRLIAAMDIGTIPFDINNPTAYYAAPNKLWEYLSQETIVATTPIPEVLRYKKFVNIIQDINDYIQVIIKSKEKRNREQLFTELRRIIERRTWDAISDAFKKLIIKLIYEKK